MDVLSRLSTVWRQRNRWGTRLPKRDIFDRMILKRAALVIAILTVAGRTYLPAQNTSKPINVDGKVLRNAGSVAADALPGSWLTLWPQPKRDPLQHAEANQ
jgi:hypothetical protein